MMIYRTQQCRVFTAMNCRDTLALAVSKAVGNINSDATGFDINCKHLPFSSLGRKNPVSSRNNEKPGFLVSVRPELII